MIESLHLVNWENHEDTLIEFAPGINIIRGSTDQGKSAIRRALTYVVTSRPTQGRPKDKTKESFVTIKITDLPSVTRGRTGGKKGKNYYKINSKEITGKESDALKAFKHKVPEEVSKILNFDEVNIQEQFKEYYLLQNTAGQVAKKIHKLIGLDLVDTTSKIINSAIRSQTKLLDSRRQTVKNIKEDIKKYDYIGNIETECGQLEKAIQDHEYIEAGIRNLQNTIERCKLLQQKIEIAKIPTEVEKTTRLLLDKFSNLEANQTKIDSLLSKIKEIEKINKEQRKFNEWGALENEAKKLQADTILLETQRTKFRRLSTLTKDLNINHQMIIKTIERYGQAEKELVKLKKKLKVCPTCSKPF